MPENKINKDPIKNFYDQSVMELHIFTAEHGYAKKGMIYVPELIKLGHEYVVDRLNDKDFLNSFDGDAATYYFNLASIALCSGICHAEAWKNDYDSKLKDGSFGGKLNERGIFEATREILGEDSDEFFAFLEAAFEKWTQLMEDNWSSPEAGSYLLQLMVAMFQVGVSIRLEGYTEDKDSSEEE